MEQDSQQIRSFIAVKLPEEVRAGLAERQEKLKQGRYNFIKWVNPAGVHLTLKFLGNVRSDKLGEIGLRMREAAKDIPPFDLEIGGLGAFPNLKRPRVLWVGVGGDLERLLALQKRIDELLKPLGFEPEARAFSPHLTLARLREEISALERQGFGEIAQRATPEGTYSFRVDKVNLMRSQLKPSGAVYTELSEARLGG